jgi:hypothetical protein
MKLESTFTNLPNHLKLRSTGGGCIVSIDVRENHKWADSGKRRQSDRPGGIEN